MIIENKWGVYDHKSNGFYAGDNERGEVVFTPIESGQARMYTSKRAANGAIAHIRRKVEALSPIALFIAREEVKDPKPAEEKPTPKKDPPIFRPKANESWEIVDKFGKIKYLKKNGNPAEFAVYDNKGCFRAFHTDELAAWLWYSELRREVGAEIIRNRK